MYQGGKTDIRYEYFNDYSYGGKLIRIQAGNVSFNLNYDKLGRYTGRKISNRISPYNDILTESIEYKQVYGAVEASSGTRYVYKQSNLPSKISYSDGKTISYTYDDSGNIITVNVNGNTVRYTYDSLDRLIYEYNPILKNTYNYTYDNNGNIKSKTVYSSLDGETYTYNYSYTDGRLTNDGMGHTMVYDSLGNPTSYRGFSLTWQKGKRLTKFGTSTFEYDGKGRRTKKNFVKYYYDYNDRLIASEEEVYIMNDGKLQEGIRKIEYFYDHIGVAGFKYNGVYYTYKRDIQGNVIAILDSNGTEVVQYNYNAWGEHTVSGSNTTLGNLNPFRYRSYFYDTETKLYFLKTRYYDPQIGRFLSMDSVQYADPESINGLNLYAYCGNNPVMNIDPDGTFAWAVLAVVAIVLLFTPIGGTICQTVASVGGYVGMAVASLFDSKIKQDMEDIHWNPFNSDAGIVASSQKVSFYKGVPVIRINTKKNRSGTFLAIFLERGESANTVKHEWGHVPQQMILGPATFGLFVGIPSAGKWGSWSKSGQYYNAPWETMADMFGGSATKHTSKEKAMAIGHLATAFMAGPLSYIFALF